MFCETCKVFHAVETVGYTDRPGAAYRGAPGGELRSTKYEAFQDACRWHRGRLTRRHNVIMDWMLFAITVVVLAILLMV